MAQRRLSLIRLFAEAPPRSLGEARLEHFVDPDLKGGGDLLDHVDRCRKFPTLDHADRTAVDLRGARQILLRHCMKVAQLLQIICKYLSAAACHGRMTTANRLATP